jgi:hypothetical protein
LCAAALGGSACGSDGGAPDSVAPDGGVPDSGAPPADASTACTSRFATSVVSFAPGPAAKGDTSLALGPPKGAGDTQGSLDVVTLGNGGSITLAFDPSYIVDAPGPDFIVFENPFYVNGDPTMVFAELATVSVSDDGQSFTDFPCTAMAPPYGSCAGWHPVYANADSNQIDPTDPTAAGGDAFDLADLGLASAHFVRITDRVDLTGTAGLFDLDAVSIVHAACP